MNTPDEINMNAENAFVLREAAKAHDMGYYDHLAHGGKGDPSEERWIEALNAGADALDCIQQLEADNAELLTKVQQLERERDELLKDISSAQGCICIICKKYINPNPGTGTAECKILGRFKDRGCDGALMCGQFEWRGAKEE